MTRRRGVNFVDRSAALASIQKSYAGTKILILLRLRGVNSNFQVLVFMLHMFQYLTNQIRSTTIKGSFVRHIKPIDQIFDFGLKIFIFNFFHVSVYLIL